MSSILDKKKKEEEAQLMKAKELREKIVSIKKDLGKSKTKLIDELKEKREAKIKNIKELEIKNKENYETFVQEYEKILNSYNAIEANIYEMLTDLKVLSERSYNEILELRKEKEIIIKDKNLIVAKKQEELQTKIDKVESELYGHSNMLNNVLIKIKEIFKKTHVDYQNET
ncbi:conserved protein, unknown function, partial [Hepatocystis sp. ex Piliocolobus tephrosceles]